MKKLLLVALVTLFSYTSVLAADIPAVKRKEIEKMLQLTGMEKLMDQIKIQMISSFKGTVQHVPAGFWEKI